MIELVWEVRSVVLGEGEVGTVTAPPHLGVGQTGHAVGEVGVDIWNALFAGILNGL